MDGYVPETAKQRLSICRVVRCRRVFWKLPNAGLSLQRRLPGGLSRGCFARCWAGASAGLQWAIEPSDVAIFVPAPSQIIAIGESGNRDSTYHEIKAAGMRIVCRVEAIHALQRAFSKRHLTILCWFIWRTCFLVAHISSYVQECAR